MEARIIADLSLYRKTDIAKGDLVIFDEIQACNDALSSLKYFHERDNEYHIASAGSLLGIRMSGPKSFPVGKVDFLDLYPMTFYEFLDATGHGRYRHYLEGLDSIRAIPEAFHLELVGLLDRYLQVGGMPEAVARYASHASDDMTAVRAIATIRIIQKAILDSYTLDFAKHAPAADIPKLSMV